jgi:anaerobic magnesium-protoporphyrin IX monomethyl ester cyclase
MRILTLNPPYFKMFSRSSRSPAVTKSSTLYYPIYLSYATGVIEKEGFQVKLIDAVAMDLDIKDTVKIIREFQPHLVVVDTSTPSIYNDIKVIEAIKEVSHAFLVLVGTHVSALAEDSLKLSHAVDAVARREYDYTIRDLARVISGWQLPVSKLRDELRQVQGLSFRLDGEIIHNPDRATIDNLNDIPFVSEVYKRHLSCCIDRYFYGANLHPVMAILSGRGCPHQCTYCVYPQTITGNRYRFRSIRNVVDELEYIRNEFPKVKEIFLEDDTLTVNRDRAIELADEILKRGLKIRWSTNSRADADYETMRKIKKAGCRLLCVGFESAQQSVLDNINKHLKLERMYQFAGDAKRAGILIHGCFIVGNPGDTMGTLFKVLELAIRLKPDTAQFYPVMVYPGTKAYQWAKENGYLTTEDYSRWLTDEGLHNCVLSMPGLTQEQLVRFCDYARRRFYLNPLYVISKITQIIKQPQESGRIFRAAGALFKHLFKPWEIS